MMSVKKQSSTAFENLTFWKRANEHIEWCWRSSERVELTELTEFNGNADGISISCTWKHDSSRWSWGWLSSD